MVKRKNIILGIIAILLPGGIYLYTQCDTFVDKYRIADDVFQATFWMNKFHNPQLFPNDIYTEYSRYLRPWGVKFVYFFLTYLWDPILAGKILGVLLFCTAAFLIYKVGQLYIEENSLSILVSPLFFSFIPIALGMFPGGFGRSFAFPALFLFLIYLKKGNLKIIAIIILLGSLFYPLLLPLISSVSAFYLLFTYLTKKNLPWEKKDFYWLTLFILMSLLIIGVKYLNRPSFLGPLLTKKEMLVNPLFESGGRSPYFPFPKYLSYLKNFLFSKNPLIAFFVLLGLEELFRLRKKDSLFIILAMIITSFILFELAKFLFIRLYLPDRYLLFLFPTLQTLLLSQGVISILKFIKLIPFRVLVLFWVIYLLIWDSNLNRLKIYRGMCQINIPIEERQLCEYLKKKPCNVFIAASPYVADAISTFAEKKVLIKFELTQAWYKNYFMIVKARTLDFFHAYYTHEIENIRELIQKYNIDYIVVNIKFFNPYILNRKEPHIYIEPFNKYITKMITETKGYNFVILKYLKKAEFNSGPYFLIPAKAFFSPPPVAKPSITFMPHFDHKCQI